MNGSPAGGMREPVLFTVDELVVTRQSDVAILFHHLSAIDVLLDNAARAGVVYVSVPHVFGIHDDHRAMTALVHASGVINAHFATQARHGNGFLQNRMNLKRSVERTRLAARADEYVTPVLSHRTKMTGSRPR
jgi:hypothetical protein